MITTESSASAHPSVEEIAARVERELMRLRAARPALSSRIDRAEALIVSQLASLNGYRPIRVRIHPDGDYSYIVRSGAKLSKTYTINPHTWSCSCPDHRRRHAACKHSISCWILERALCTPARSKAATCNGCGERFERRELIEVQEEHESLTWFVGDAVCRSCARGTDIV